MLTEIFLLLTILLTPSIEPLWRHLCLHVPQYPMFVIACFTSQLIGYFLGCLPFLLLDIFRPLLTARYKIQPDKYPSRRTMRASCLSMLWSFVSVVLPLLVLGGFFIDRVGISRDAPFPTWRVVLVQVAFFFLVEDYLNYWVHRWLHLPWWYKHIHSVHHTYDAPFALVAAYAHPVEVLLQAVPTFAGPLMVGPHLYTLMVWQVFRNWEAIDIHSGYELPLSLKSVLPGYAGAQHHDYHHYMHSGNFASVFTWCDRLYGTNLGYERFREKSKVKE